MYLHQSTLNLHCQFEPKAGPTRGGTVVTINGTDLGARRVDIVVVMINGVNCTIRSYTPGVS